MKKHLAMLLIIPLLAGCASCALLLTSRGQSWDMIQSVGGLRVDDPATQPDGTTFLPVVCNVSGLEEITVKPTTINSALVVKKTTARFKEDSIQIQIVTCVVDDKHTSVSKGVDLGTLSSGIYQVEYLNPDGSTIPLKQIEIK